jgi:16S rRNA C967 or C1407 C5-methylase (RsmB/RsmF family)
LYSTCALCPQENDGMIERLYKKFNKDGTAFTLLEPEPGLDEISAFASLTLPGFEKTQYGYMIMPDKQNGAGPIYFSIIKKEKSI